MLHIVFCYMILYFNPRSHERSDPVLSSVPLGSVPISIHAPTRGATETGAHQSNEFVFQSTLPREERLRSAGCVSCTMNISIHAPTRGATGYQQNNVCHNIFQSTLPREERLYPSFMKCPGCRFQSTLPREERPYREDQQPRQQNFNPRSHERSDTSSRFTLSIMRYFNPRSHERSDSNIAQKICLFLYNTDNKYIIR